jgi:hypothetical protein
VKHLIWFLFFFVSIFFIKNIIIIIKIWRQTTWSGWFVRQLQGIGHHIYPFIEAVNDAMNREQSNNTTMLGFLLLILVRMIVIGSCILVFFGLSQCFSYFMTKEITIVEEIIVDDTIDSTSDGNATTTKRQTRRTI